MTSNQPHADLQLDYGPIGRSGSQRSNRSDRVLQASARRAILSRTDQSRTADDRRSPLRQGARGRLWRRRGAARDRASVDELHGIDLDADPALAEAWLGSHGRTARLIKGSVYELPYETAEFDLALCFSVFEHLHQYEQGLREVARVLKPGGRFLLGMPAVNPMMELGFRAIGFKRINESHVTTPRAVASAFDRAGLRVTQHVRLRLMPGLPLHFNWLLEKAA